MVQGSGDTGILCLATHGSDHLDARRLEYLLEPLQPEVFAFDYRRKASSAIGLVKAAIASRPRLIVMEGTGIAGGFALLVVNLALGIPFVVSSGDAVGPFLRLRSPLAGLLGGLYERLLYRRCAGFIGWTPYLVGRALTLGAPRGMTAAGWGRNAFSEDARAAVRQRLGIDPDAIVVGLVGSLDWTDSVSYVYGLELVRAVRRVQRSDVVACIVGDGPGRSRLEQSAGSDLGGKVVLAGRVEPEQVADHLAAFDIASLSQSVDQVGSFRYTTKLSEYLSAGLPVLSGQIPAAYDLDSGFFWRLPGSAPWSDTYVDALVELLDGLDETQIAARRAAIDASALAPFDRSVQQQRVVGFVSDLLRGASG